MERDNFYNEIFAIIKQSASEHEKFDIPDFGIYTTVWATAIIFETCIALAVLSTGSEGTLTSKMVFLLCILVIVIFSTISFPLFFIYKNKLLEYKDVLDQSLIAEQLNQMGAVKEQCKNCINIKKGNVINAYNLYTYAQIIQIENRLGMMEGEERAVFAYSMYRDDGPGVGVRVAEETIDSNGLEGVPYYFLFYKEKKDTPKLGSPVYWDNNRLYINLSEHLGKNIHNSLDYQFYEQTFFDVMLYKYNENKVDGYYTLNFPVEKDCDYRNTCPLDCRNHSTENVFYKKMPKDIAEDLCNQLSRIVKDIIDEREKSKTQIHT